MIFQPPSKAVVLNGEMISNFITQFLLSCPGASGLWPQILSRMIKRAVVRHRITAWCALDVFSHRLQRNDLVVVVLCKAFMGKKIEQLRNDAQERLGSCDGSGRCWRLIHLYQRLTVIGPIAVVFIQAVLLMQNRL